MNNATSKTYPQAVDITADDLPLHCPNPHMDPASWHPRVFLTLDASGRAMCPYCGTRYTLKGGMPHSHH
ncbi:zinc-finger domain-containing protein [Nitrosomonas mobilis]|uniref:zinc-finger domain-containing protein n=1 Tax=Nitrosomonas mobilis TaxID=51642 RepID=UPI000A6DFE37|nr:zinc-finger domain-containing protein [Nitrosomonas mobilis]HNO74880.1 zinc-finger domain-containing protein [Nitrosomonas mobilis]